jgi:hypothetical protein
VIVYLALFEEVLQLEDGLLLLADDLHIERYLFYSLLHLLNQRLVAVIFLLEFGGVEFGLVDCLGGFKSNR